MFDGSGTGVSVGSSTSVGVPVTGTMITAVLVGLGVRVAVGRMIVGAGSSRFVGVRLGMNGVRVKVGEEVGEEVNVGVGVNVLVGDGVATNSANASEVRAAAVFKFEKARLAIFPGSITIGVGRVGSERAIADVAQKKLNPIAPATKIQRSPA